MRFTRTENLKYPPVIFRDPLLKEFTFQMSLRIFIQSLLIGTLLLPVPIHAETTESFGIEIMHKSDVGRSSDAALDSRLISQYSRRLGRKLTWQARTPTRAHRLLLPPGSSKKTALNAATKLRGLDGVLWSGTFTTEHVKEVASGQKTLVRQMIIKPKNAQPGICPDNSVTLEYSLTAGVSLKPVQALTSGACLYRLAKVLTLPLAQSAAERLRSLPSVQYVDLVNGIRKMDTETPRDPYFPAMWFLQENNDFPGSSDIQQAWTITTGRPDVTVAVLDSGILFNPTHPDLVTSLTYLNQNHSQIAGWDMISNSWQARDGNSRDRNPRDEGTWITAAQTRLFPECESMTVQTSSWHGSHVSGTIAAATNNRIGISGINWQVRLLPVRVIGACEGALSDLADGIYWAASGLDVPGTEPNPYPAQVINISLGGEGTCPNSLQEAIDFALSRNVTVVIAAGNETTDVIERGMANCKGALIVAASGMSGDLTTYSNYGLDITIAAPGGEPSFGNFFEIISTLNGSTTRPSASKMKYGYASGTSMAAPVVSGVVSLMISAAMDRGQTLSSDAIRSILTETAKPYPMGSRCGPGGELEGLCGAGVINAAAAVAMASNYVSPVIQ